MVQTFTKYIYIWWTTIMLCACASRACCLLRSLLLISYFKLFFPLLFNVLVYYFALVFILSSSLSKHAGGESCGLFFRCKTTIFAMPRATAAGPLCLHERSADRSEASRRGDQIYWNPRRDLEKDTPGLQRRKQTAEERSQVEKKEAYEEEEI